MFRCTRQLKPGVYSTQASSNHPDPATSSAPWRVFNIGNSQPVNLIRYIEVLEKCLGHKALVELLPMQPGDVRATIADVSDLKEATGFRPNTSVETP